MYLRSLAYINNLRTQKGTDWAFVIFVADSEMDTDGMFSDGYFAYAYLYGPMMVMTYDNEGWGINQMNKVAAHETGHIFGAGDQYYQANYGGCESKTEKYGYLGVANSNCDNPTATGVPSIMKSNTMVLDPTARDQLGWRDSDSDGTFDPLDTPPSFNLNNYTPNPTTNTSLSYSGTTSIEPWSHALCSTSDNCYTRDVTTQKLTVDYSVDGGPWQGASAADGSFSSDYEGFYFTTGFLSSGSHDISVRSLTSQATVTSTWPDTVTIQPPTSSVASVDDFPGLLFELDTNNEFNDTVDTTGATPDTNGIFDPTPIQFGDCSSNKSEASVWYRYAPDVNINLYVDTLGSNYDTLLAVWEGDGGEIDPENLTLVTCNDDIGTYENQSKVGFYAQSGTVYYIEVINYSEPPSSGSMPQAQADWGGILKFNVQEGNFSVTDVYINGGDPVGNYLIPTGESVRVTYDNVDNGPVKVVSTNGVPIIASMRINLKTLPSYASYSEFMGIPASKLTDTYLFPWYNNATTGGLSSQLRFGNVGSDPTLVTVTIGGVERGSYPLDPNESARVTFDNVDAGPVEVTSSGGVPIIASMRINLKTLPSYSSYSEFMGLSASATPGTSYLFPWYNNATTGGLSSQLRFGNVGSDPTLVTVTIGGVERGSYPLDPNESARVTFDNVDAGPVEVTSSGGVPIIASMRINLKTLPSYSSYSEFMGLPGAMLTETRYLFPWYNNATTGGLSSQLRFGNVGSDPTLVTVTIGGVERGSYPLDPNESARVTFDNVDAGPVEVSSSGGVPIIASMRINLKSLPAYSSYSEFMGLSVGSSVGMPGNELSSTYWFPWYNNATTGGLSSQLRFGVP